MNKIIINDLSLLQINKQSNLETFNAHDQNLTKNKLKR